MSPLPRTAPVPDVRWASVFAGAVAAVGLWTLLYSLGLALGLSSVDPNDPSSMRASGVFTGVWGLVSPLVALFIGGAIAGRGGLGSKLSQSTHGLVMWGVTTVVGVWMLSGLAAGLIGGAVKVGETAVQAGATAVGSAAGAAAGGADNMASAARSFGLDADDALRPINARLQAEGKPAITPEQLQSATRDVVQQGMQQGRIDREVLVASVAKSTALSRADAEEVASRVEAQLNTAKASVERKATELGQTIQTKALETADATGKVFWGVFGSLFLGMLAAIAGALMGAGLKERTDVRVMSTHERVAPASAATVP